MEKVCFRNSFGAWKLRGDKIVSSPRFSCANKPFRGEPAGRLTCIVHMIRAIFQDSGTCESQSQEIVKFYCLTLALWILDSILAAYKDYIEKAKVVFRPGSF